MTSRIHVVIFRDDCTGIRVVQGHFIGASFLGEQGMAQARFDSVINRLLIEGQGAP